MQTLLKQSDWQERSRRHETRLRPLIDPHLARRSRGIKHPTIDFLFEYYGYRPGGLLRWNPDFRMRLQGDAAREFLARKGYGAFDDETVGLDPTAFGERRQRAARWMLELQEAMAARPPMLGCFALHEWAMVYEEKDIRHPQLGLRLPHDEVRRVVDTLPVICSHFDAFRFFSKSARPKNLRQPRESERAEFEQPGCLHANMDLYKWVCKLQPWLGSDLLADAFLLATEIREVDMRASAYDVAKLGLEPIPVETQEGRLTFMEIQRELAQRAAPLRQRLIDLLRELLDWA